MQRCEFHANQMKAQRKKNRGNVLKEKKKDYIYKKRKK